MGVIPENLPSKATIFSKQTDPCHLETNCNSRKSPATRRMENRGVNSSSPAITMDCQMTKIDSIPEFPGTSQQRVGCDPSKRITV